MNIWQHCLLSQRKFGGQPQDYEEVHAFMDSSKLFFYHFKHRALLHHLFGVELAIRLLGNFVVNAEGKTVLVRDIAVEHCREDLDGKIPTLFDWFKDSEHLLKDIQMPDIQEKTLQEFVYLPYLSSGLRASLLITCSDFGVHLVKVFLGIEKAIQWASLLKGNMQVKNWLPTLQLKERWQYSPQKEELKWLEMQEKTMYQTNLTFRNE
jgi:hypothetical protein